MNLNLLLIQKIKLLAQILKQSIHKVSQANLINRQLDKITMVIILFGKEHVNIIFHFKKS